MTTRTYNVPDVHCDHCVAAINRELGQIDGVERVDVDLGEKTVTVDAREHVTEEQIIEGLYEAGYDVEAA